MSRREEIIVEMLKRYKEAEDAGIHDGLGDGDGYPGMPPTWNASYKRLAEFLDVMRENEHMRTRWWHVTQRYKNAEIVTLEVKFKKTAKGPVPILPPHTEMVAGASEVGEFTSLVRVRRWNPKVREEKARKGVELLAEMFDNEPYLPTEFELAA